MPAISCDIHKLEYEQEKGIEPEGITYDNIKKDK